MSITIRLSRIGKKNSPSYTVVVANTKDKRNGRSIDVLGHYNPSNTPVLLSIDKEKYTKWTKNGALVTDPVKKLLEGKYIFTPYRPKKAGEAEKQEA